MKLSKITVLVLCVLSFGSCKNFYDVGKSDNESLPVSIKCSSQASQTIADLWNLQIIACEKAEQAVNCYVQEPVYAKSVSSNMSFDDIGKYLPADLSTLTRSCSKSRSASGVISLKEELDSIAAEYEAGLKKIIPDHTKSVSLAGINATETGYVFGDDAGLPFDSLDGIITTAVLNEVADGKNIKDVLKTIEEDFSSYGVSNSRAVHETYRPVWPNGVINYRWGDISELHKSVVKYAMDIWQYMSDYCISFEEIDDTDWNDFSLKIGVKGCVIYSDAELPFGCGGSSSVGYTGGVQYMLMARDLDWHYLVCTPIHEMGHVLGLHHEHVRYDRDEYLVISEEENQDTVNFGIIPEIITKSRIETHTVVAGHRTIDVRIPVYWEEINCLVSDSFDFESVMLYGNLEVQPDKRALNDGYMYTNFHEKPSQKDAEMIKRIYQ